MKHSIYITALFILLFSCEQKIEKPYQRFLIPEGKHDNGWKMESLQSSILNFSAVFNHTAIYQTRIKENQHDINKLMGFSDCNSHHHENSARFGWRWLEGKLEIHAYVYAKGERITKYIGEVSLDKSYDYQIQIADDEYVFHLQEHDPVRITRKSNCNRGLYYKLFPYFGGDETAPQDITIQILMNY